VPCYEKLNSECRDCGASINKEERIVADKTQEIIAELAKAYNMELETVTNYIAASTNLDGVRAEEIKKSLAADIPAELAHAQLLAKRIKTLGGQVPGSQALKFEQATLQPLPDSTDVVAVIKGVLDAEGGAIKQYSKLIRRGLRDAGYVHHDSGRRRRTPPGIPGLLEGVREGAVSD